jgi:hypothetical protein
LNYILIFFNHLLNYKTMSVPSFSYSEVIPENSKDSYTAHENVDFLLNFEGRAINLGSIRIEGELEAKYDGKFLNSTDDVNGVINQKDIFYNPSVGAHACFESIQTSIQGAVVENVQDYPRWVTMVTKATSEQGDVGNNSDQSCELKTSYKQATNQLLQGTVVAQQPTAAVRLNPDFGVKPMIALNSSSRAMPYSKSGQIRITLNLARTNAIFFGKDVDGQLTYSVKDLRVTFSSIPEADVDPKMPITLRTKLGMKQSIQSTLASVALRVPAVCSGVSCSFLPQGQENSAVADSLEMTTVPNLKSIQYSFNDITSSLVTFRLKSMPEFIQGYIDSMLDTGLNALGPDSWANQEGFGVGTSFSGMVDLRNQKFAVQLNSDISNNDPHIIYLFFHSVMQL